MSDISMSELEQWRQQAQHWHDEAERLRKELEGKQQITTAANPPLSLIDNVALIEDLARYSEGGLTRNQVKRRWKESITKEMWKTLGDDNELVDAIEARKIQRIRDGSLKRERAQAHITKAPDVLEKIMSNERENARHRIDSAKALDALADPGKQTTPSAEKFYIRIDLTGDSKLKGIEPDPKDIINLEVTPRKTPAAITDGSEG